MKKRLYKKLSQKVKVLEKTLDKLVTLRLSSYDFKKLALEFEVQTAKYAPGADVYPSSVRTNGVKATFIVHRSKVGDFLNNYHVREGEVISLA